MKPNEAPEKIYICPSDRAGIDYDEEWSEYPCSISIEYTCTDALIEKVINFLNYKLDDIVAIRVPGTIIPHHIVKQELIEDLKKHMKGE